MSTIGTDIQGNWEWLLQEIELAKNHNAFVGIMGPPASTDIADLLLPGLLFVRTTSLLDEALLSYIKAKNLRMPSRFDKSLHGRLDFLDTHGVLSYTQDLKDLRLIRNNISHQPSNIDAFVQPFVNWLALDNAIGIIEKTLQTLVLVGPRPKYKFFLRRDVDLSPPGKPDVRVTHHYYYGIEEEGVKKIKFSKSVDFHAPKSGVA